MNIIVYVKYYIMILMISDLYKHYERVMMMKLL